MKSHTSHFRFLPVKDSLETKGLEIKAHDLETTRSVDLLGWRKTVPQIRNHYAAFGDRLPNELATALADLESSLN